MQLEDARFIDFFEGNTFELEYQIAKLSASDMVLFGANNDAVWLSRQSLDEHKLKHPEIGASDYLKIQNILDCGEVYRQKQNRFVLLKVDGVLYRSAIKVVNGGNKTYMLTIFKTTEELATIQIRNKFKLARRALKG